MTTFTMQDLTPTQQDQLQQHEQNHAIIQGATGAQYTPIDLTQFHKPIEEINKPTVQQLADQLTLTFNTLIKQLLDLQAGDKQPVSSSSGDLRECVDTVLQNSGWMDDMVKEQCEIAVTDGDFSYEIESAVETHFSNSFCLEDHLDVTAEIESIIDDKLEDIVENKIKELLEEKLSTATISFN